MIDKNDPRLTAYALGELDASDSAKIASALNKSPELQAVVAEIQLAAGLTSDAFASQPQLQLTPEQKNELFAAASQAQATTVGSPTIAKTRRPWLSIAIAASLLGLMVGGAFYLSGLSALNVNSSVAKTDAASTESIASTVADESDAEIAASETKENASSSLPRSAPFKADPTAEKIQPSRAAGQAFARGMAKESNQHLAPKDLVAGDNMVAGDNKNRLRYSEGSQADAPKRSFAQSQKPKLAQERDSMVAPKQLLKYRQENATDADMFDNKAARTPGAGMKGETLPSQTFNKAELASGKHSAGGEAGIFHSSGKQLALGGVIEDQELQLAQQAIDRSDLGSLGVKLAKQHRSKRRQATVIELSEEQADQMVQLLANRFDPGNDLQFTFAELVAPTAPKSRPSAIQQVPADPSIDTEILEADSDLAAADLDDNKLAGITHEGRKQSTQLIAATQLAAAVWRFQQQQLGSDEEELDTMLPLNAQRKIVSPDDALALHHHKTPLASAPVKQDAASPAKKLPPASQNSFAAPAIAPQDLATRISSQALQNLDIDYTDLILQLKRSLLKRNAEVRQPARSATSQD